MRYAQVAPAFLVEMNVLNQDEIKTHLDKVVAAMERNHDTALSPSLRSLLLKRLLRAITNDAGANWRFRRRCARPRRTPRPGSTRRWSAASAW